MSVAKSRWHGALRSAHELYTWPRVLEERWREERTGSSSLNLFQVVFTRVVVESSQPPAAESMSPRYQKEAANAGGSALSVVKSRWHGALRSAHELYTWPHVLEERWREERTGSSSLNLFQAVFTRVVVESSQPPAAESMSPRYQKEATTSSLSGLTWTSFCGLPSKGRAVPCHHVHL